MNIFDIKPVYDLAERCHTDNVKAGWWTDTETGLDLIRIVNAPANPWERLLSGALIAQKLCLTHSEVSEAMEGARKNLMDDKLPHRKMIEVELADAIIRIFDLGGALRLDVAGAIFEKLEFNRNRPDHKLETRLAVGGKKF
jgi:hypothetical protein